MLQGPKKTYVDRINDRKECSTLWTLSGNKSFLREVEGWQMRSGRKGYSLDHGGG